MLRALVHAFPDMDITIGTLADMIDRNRPLPGIYADALEKAFDAFKEAAKLRPRD